jgi:steroid 5-alpha reductase family enzyme
MAHRAFTPRCGLVGLHGIMIAGPFTLVLTAYLVMAAVMMGLWVLQLRVRNISIADAGWCAGLIAVVLWYATQAAGEIERKVLVAVLALLYGGRLGLHILFNRVIGKTEEARYRHLREQWGSSESVRIFGYFQLQALAVAAFSLPFLILIQNPRPPFALIEYVGLLIWVVAVSGEAIADWQLAQFRAKLSNHDRVCRNGLWRYSRHPNFFFEWVHWWSYVVLGMSTPGWFLTWIGPIGMGWALLKVTGIPWVERQALASRGEDYREYQRTTSSFIPWFPKTR